MVGGGETIALIVGGVIEAEPFTPFSPFLMVAWGKEASIGSGGVGTSWFVCCWV